VLTYLRGDTALWVSPSNLVGPRSYARTTPPIWLSRAAIEAVLARLNGPIGPRVGAMIRLARELGLRWRETALLDAVATLEQALRHEQVTIAQGTKGGQARRFAVVSDYQLKALRCAASAQGHAENVIPAAMSYRNFAETASRAFYAAGGRHFHDFRASYACERYQGFTGWLAPVLGGQILGREADLAARLAIAEELGHHRVDIVSCYIGGRK
jgi:integrase